MKRAIFIAVVVIIAVVAAAAFWSACEDDVEPKGEIQSGPDALELAQTYAPYLVTVKQAGGCDETFDTDAYKPTSVDAYLNKRNVSLKTRRNVKARPAAADAGSGKEGSYFDIFWSSPQAALSPFNPDDRCQYEANNRSANAPTVYAQVRTDDGETALQFMLFYYLNDYINIHEGDWEVIELLFPSSSPRDIVLNRMRPTWVAYSQHTSGRAFQWRDIDWWPEGNRPEEELTHPVVYVASGSHANYEMPGFLQARVDYWFDNCDLTVPKDDLERADILEPRTDYTLMLVDRPELDQNFVWTPFPGKWGETHIVPVFGFDGTKSPFVETSGLDPWAWKKDLREGASYSGICANREVHPRNAHAERRMLEEGIGSAFRVRILVGDLVVFFVNWFGSDVSLKVQDPDDNVIPPENSGNVMYEKGKTYEVYRIKNGGAGTWTVTATGTGLPGGREWINFWPYDLPVLCDEVDEQSDTRDSDFDGLPNSRDEDPCYWDHDGDGISDGCDSGSLTFVPDTCTDPLTGLRRTASPLDGPPISGPDIAGPD